MIPSRIESAAPRDERAATRVEEPMTRSRTHVRSALAAVAIALLLGCGDDDPPATAPFVPDGTARPDFSLVDVNANSATSGRAVSPRDYLGKVSAWYFGAST